MKLHRTDKQASLSELARTLFAIEGPRAAADEKRAIDALKKANPHLTARGAVPAGSALAVPEVERLTHRRSDIAAIDLGENTGPELREAIAAASEALDAARSEAQKADDEEVALLGRHARELKGTGEDISPARERIKKAAIAREAQRKAQRELQRDAIARLEKDLAVVLEAVRR